MTKDRLLKAVDEVAREYTSWATSNVPRIPLGFPIIDDRTNGGIALGELVFFVARPSVGKTAWALNVVANNPSVPTLMFSIEMHGRYIIARLAAIVSRVPTNEIERDLKQYGNSWALEQTAEDFTNFSVVDRPNLKLEDLMEGVRQYTDQHKRKPQLVIVDYLELIAKVKESAVEAVDEASVALKKFARESDTAVIVLHQVGREQGGNGDFPLGLRSGRYGGEQAADYFLAAYRPCLNPRLTMDEYLARQHEWYLQFLKNRAGGEIHPQGVMHWLEVATMKITDQRLGQTGMNL